MLGAPSGINAEEIGFYLKSIILILGDKSHFHLSPQKFSDEENL
jgi:hypothetical protein